jgi:hypothetical protein
MSSLYISTGGSLTSSSGVWRVSSADYQYTYNAFTPGEDINLDQVSVSTNTYDFGQSAPNNFQVGLYSAGIDAQTPGPLITYLSGPSSPVAGAYNAYAPTNSLDLSAGTQYWLGFTLSSDNGGTSSTRVKINNSNGSSSYAASSWSVGSRYVVGTGAGLPTNSANPVTFQLYGTASAVCFCSGTAIKTSAGDKMIDELKVGDLVWTSHGNLPVKWVAKRTIYRRLTPKEKYEESFPIRIEKGALSELVPNADLLVSGSHGIHVDGRIVAAIYLVNDLSIYKDKASLYPDSICYFHLEFDDEVFVFANGTEACSYVNEGNRRSFDNFPEFVSLYGNADSSVRSYLTKSPRNNPSLQGHKTRVTRTWQAA